MPKFFLGGEPVKKMCQWHILGASGSAPSTVWALSRQEKQCIKRCFANGQNDAKSMYFDVVPKGFKNSKNSRLKAEIFGKKQKQCDKQNFARQQNEASNISFCVGKVVRSTRGF